MRFARIAVIAACAQGLVAVAADAADPAAKPALSADAAALKAVDERWMEAAKKEDLDAVMALYADDAVLFDPGSMQARGKEAIKQAFAAMFAQHDNINVQMLNPIYHASGDLGYSASLFRMSATGKGGEKIDMSGRVSAVFTKKGGKWLYQVDHASASPGGTPSPDGAVKAP